MTEVSSLTGRLLVATPVLADPNFDRAVVLLLDHDEAGSLGVVLNRPTPVNVGDILEPWAALAGEPGVVFQGGPVSLDAALGVAVVPSGRGDRTDGAPGRGDRTDGAAGSGPDAGAAALGDTPRTAGDRPGRTRPGEPPSDAPGAASDGAFAASGGSGAASGETGAASDGARASADEPGDEALDPDTVLDTDGPLGWRRVHGAIGLVDLEAPPELLAAELGSLRIFAGYAGWGPGQLEKELSEGAWYVVESEPGDVSSPAPEGLWRSVLRRQRSELALVATYPDDPSLN
ncbi:YqgE/AlgH family protein [Streptomyces albus]|uniref:YqgE/AlgH family protein n=1 Tax=Streptomyces albus TaxID=1888 RepID=UPI0033DDED05